MKALSRRWRDKLGGIINEFKRECEDAVADIGIFRGIHYRAITRKRGDIWAIIRKFYETTEPNIIIDHAKKLFSIKIPNEERKNRIIRMMSYALLSLWMGYYLATIHKNPTPIREIHPYTIKKIFIILKDYLSSDILLDKTHIDQILRKYSEILCFACESIKESFFSGIEIDKDTIANIIKEIDLSKVIEDSTVL